MRHRFALLSGLVGAVALAGPVLADSGRLARAGREVEGERTRHHEPEREPRSTRAEPREPARVYERRFHVHSHGRDYSDAPCGHGCAVLLADDGESEDTLANPPATYASYPYASAYSPYLLEPQRRLAMNEPLGFDTHLLRDDSVGRPWAGQVMLDGGYMLGVAHTGLDARLLTPSLFQLALRATVLYEPALQDRAVLGAAEFGLRAISLRPLLVHLFASALYFEQGGYENSGGELGIGLELFVGRPWVVTARGSGAILGDSVVSRARVQLGYLFTRYELFVAYEHLRIGSVNLSAPRIGTRLWL